MIRMHAQALADTASRLFAADKGLLAMDESNPTCNQRFARLGIPATEAARRAYRELLVTTPGLGAYISGAILYDETLRQQTREGVRFVDVLADAGILVGIKVDMGAKDMAGQPGERITEGLDGLRERLHEYAQLHARFAKWRAVLTVGEGLPSRACIAANAHALARYAALCQEAGLVPIVEPEVLMDGEHSMARDAEITEALLWAVFDELHRQGVALEGLVLKPNMVLPGSGCPRQEPVDEVADATLRCLLRAVPAAVPGVAFLSGGPGQRGGLGPPERDDRALRGAAAVGARLLVRARPGPAGARDLARRRRECAGGPARAAASRALQPGRAPRRIYGRDGAG